MLGVWLCSAARRVLREPRGWVQVKDRPSGPSMRVFGVVVVNWYNSSWHLGRVRVLVWWGGRGCCDGACGNAGPGWFAHSRSGSRSVSRYAFNPWAFARPALGSL